MKANELLIAGCFRLWFQVKIPDKAYVNLTLDCDRFLAERGYLNWVPEAEKGLSLAFSIIMYRDVEQVERLLRLIYRYTVDTLLTVAVQLAGQGHCGSMSLDGEWAMRRKCGSERFINF